MTFTSPAEQTRSAIKNLRIRFWGVQGSCPLFPEVHEVEDYKTLVARDAIRRVLEDLRQRGNGQGLSVEEILRGPLNEGTVAAYQRQLGITDLPVFGGETTCVSIETSDKQIIILDGGSGIRNASKFLLRHWGSRPRELSILATHEHLDHRCGLPFCQFCYVRPGFHVTLYGTRQLLDALDQRYGLFSRQTTAQMHYDDPIDYRSMAATFEGVEVPRSDGQPQNDPPRHWRMHEPGQLIHIGGTTVEPFDVYHGFTRCIAYKIRHKDVTFVFCTDHELRHGPHDDDPRQRQSLGAEKRLVEKCRGADLAYFDGQYFLEEYLGQKGIGATAPVSRIDWGHGCIEDVLRRCRECGVKHALIGHHDPERIWQERLELDQRLRAMQMGNGCSVELAKSDMVVDL